MIVYMWGRGFKKKKKKKRIKKNKKRKKKKDMRGSSINSKILKICSSLFDLSVYICEDFS